ncbi:MAG TPA: GDSL-type esterase/lipase family protein [Cyclobacteriaceae bacterium]|nr:GDSL-type esterase/lipase family protein [Cyclobacteriaceae bacterium]
MTKLLLIAALFVAGTSLAQKRGYDTLPNLPDHYTQRLAKFRAEKAETGKIMFLGNSITEGGNWRKLLKDSSVVNRGISGDNTFGVIKRIDEVIRFQPSKLFMLIGVNDLSKNIPNSAVIENIFSIVSMIHSGAPKTKIYVQSLLPVNPGVKGFMTRFSKQSDILEINGQLKKYADVLKYEYVDIHTAFRDGKEMLDARYTYDGLHLNAAGYQHWVEYLKKNSYIE